MKTKLQLIAEEAHASRPKRVLDIGYAQEPNTYLYKEGVEVYGIDIVEVPTSYTGTQICDLNTTAIPFEDGAFDVVTMGCTLAHVANPLKVLSGINRVLKPDGVLILSSPNPNYYWEMVLNTFFNHFKNRVSKAKHLEHFFEFSRYNMRAISDRAGFKVVNEIGISFYVVKTSLRFNVERYPGIAYEIIYTLQKTGKPESYATFEDKEGIHKIETELFS